MTQGERITALETKVAQLIEEQRETNRQLADLLALRYRGAGAFWLASMLFGTSIVAAIGSLITWARS